MATGSVLTISDSGPQTTNDEDALDELVKRFKPFKGLEKGTPEMYFGEQVPISADKKKEIREYFFQKDFDEASQRDIYYDLQWMKTAGRAREIRNCVQYSLYVLQKRYARGSLEYYYGWRYLSLAYYFAFWKEGELMRRSFQNDPVAMVIHHAWDTCDLEHGDIEMISVLSALQFPPPEPMKNPLAVYDEAIRGALKAIGLIDKSVEYLEYLCDCAMCKDSCLLHHGNQVELEKEREKRAVEWSVKGRADMSAVSDAWVFWKRIPPDIRQLMSVGHTCLAKTGLVSQGLIAESTRGINLFLGRETDLQVSDEQPKATTPGGPRCGYLYPRLCVVVAPRMMHWDCAGAVLRSVCNKKSYGRAKAEHGSRLFSRPDAGKPSDIREVGAIRMRVFMAR